MGVKPEPFEVRLTGPRPRLDPRRHLARDGLVEIDLAGSVAAARYVAPAAMRGRLPVAPLRGAPSGAATAVSELLYGEAFDIFDSEGDWRFGRTVADGYLGWVAADALAAPGPAPVATVTARAAPVFAQADIKSPVLAVLPFGAALAGENGERFLALGEGGFVHNAHLVPLASPTPLSVARLFGGAPYLWGGRTPAGVDCSGLVQAALAACGIAAPRDSDQQLAEVGRAVPFEDRMAGDLVFFPGHVGLLVDRQSLFHANAHWMSVVEEPLAAVIGRLVASGAATPVSGVRRLAAA